jgi:hypothetical protein
MLFFNYRTELNGLWAEPGLKREFSYEAVYPAGENIGLTVDL